MSVRVRFAPSPTGYLHIGGVRTALFNWLFARRHGGTFILRIDDTDEQRNVQEALQPILDGFRWLGLPWDEGPDVGGPHGPYFQSQRKARHQEAVRSLVERGHAYWDYARTDELEAERKAAAGPYRYSRTWMATTPADRARFEADGRTAVIRLKMPREGVCRFRDLVRDDVEFEWAREQDHVVQRPDGTCLYHLASAVDDHDMDITHVIRAEEHLPNTPRQIFIMQGLGYAPPQYAHLPYVAEPGSHNKLSKRKLDTYLKNPAFKRMHEHGAAIAKAVGAGDVNPVMVEFYKTVGYLPDAIVNYLLLLGWSFDNKTEFFTRDEMTRNFSLDRVTKSPASFDPDKLMAFQDRYMREVPMDAKLAMLRRYEPRADEAIVKAAGDRIKVAGDILDYRWAYDDDFAVDEKAFEKRVRGSADLLREYRAELGAATFDAAALEAHMGAFVAKRGIKIGQIIHAVRVAVTGQAVGFGLFETLVVLGRERCLARIDKALART